MYLKEKIKEQGLTSSDVADKIGMNLNLFYMKLNELNYVGNNSEVYMHKFKDKELEKIAEALKVDTCEIYFGYLNHLSEVCKKQAKKQRFLKRIGFSKSETRQIINNC